MANVKGITIELGLGDKSKLKLRAIAKHVGALADDLDAIDSNECSELSTKQIELLQHMVELNQRTGMSICECDVKRVLELSKEVSKVLEGSD